MQGFLQRAVDKPVAVDFDRRKEPGQRRTGLNRDGNGHMLIPLGAERHRCARIEVRGDQKQLPVQLPEIIGEAGE